MNREELTKLPGRPEEQAWLRERLEVLTVREGIALDAAIQRHPVQDSAEAVAACWRISGRVRGESGRRIQSYEDPGLPLDLEEVSPPIALKLRDYIESRRRRDRLGRHLRGTASAPRLGCREAAMTAYPEREPGPAIRRRITLPGPDCSWSLRLELASPA
ncbi:MAG: hypothetical protein ACLRWQ_07830 [Flavonifractor plautii]